MALDSCDAKAQQGNAAPIAELAAFGAVDPSVARRRQGKGGGASRLATPPGLGVGLGYRKKNSFQKQSAK